MKKKRFSPAHAQTDISCSSHFISLSRHYAAMAVPRRSGTGGAGRDNSPYTPAGGWTGKRTTPPAPGKPITLPSRRPRLAFYHTPKPPRQKQKQGILLQHSSPLPGPDTLPCGAHVTKNKTAPIDCVPPAPPHPPTRLAASSNDTTAARAITE